jgi:hypothetical protein
MMIYYKPKHADTEWIDAVITDFEPRHEKEAVEMFESRHLGQRVDKRLSFVNQQLMLDEVFGNANIRYCKIMSRVQKETDIVFENPNITGSEEFSDFQFESIKL